VGDHPGLLREQGQGEGQLGVFGRKQQLQNALFYAALSVSDATRQVIQVPCQLLIDIGLRRFASRGSFSRA
jgi:hypothetical protein